MDENSDVVDVPWPTERVLPSQLRVGDFVKHNDHQDWVTIVRIVEAGENQPEWEKPLGTRAFHCEHIGEGGRRTVLIAYDGHDQHTVIRRKDEPATGE